MIEISIEMIEMIEISIEMIEMIEISIEMIEIPTKSETRGSLPMGFQCMHLCPHIAHHSYGLLVRPDYLPIRPQGFAEICVPGPHGTQNFSQSEGVNLEIWAALYRVQMVQKICANELSTTGDAGDFRPRECALRQTERFGALRPTRATRATRSVHRPRASMRRIIGFFRGASQPRAVSQAPPAPAPAPGAAPRPLVRLRCFFFLIRRAAAAPRALRETLSDLCGQTLCSDAHATRAESSPYSITGTADREDVPPRASVDRQDERAVKRIRRDDDSCPPTTATTPPSPPGSDPRFSPPTPKDEDSTGN